jgi:hypothetical protein
VGQALWGENSTLPWAPTVTPGLQCCAFGPVLDGSCFIDSIDFMFICEGTEYEVTK